MAAVAPFNEVRYIMQRRHPARLAWLEQNAAGNEFARSLLTRINEGRELSEKQAAALERCAIQPATSTNGITAPRQAPVAAAKVSIEPMVAALNAAHESGLKNPKLRTERFEFSRAPDTGRNPGAIYVTTPGDTYLGKIINGELFTSRDCTAELRDAIVAVCADPLAAAKLYGRQTGRCSCCGRELTDPASIEAAIGPICAEKFRL